MPAWDARLARDQHSKPCFTRPSLGLFDMTLPQNPAIYTHNTPFNALMGGQADPATFVQGTPQEGTSFSGPRCSGSTTPASSILSEEETLGRCFISYYLGTMSR